LTPCLKPGDWNNDKIFVFSTDKSGGLYPCFFFGQKIAVEVKSFLGASDVTEFHTALGQFLNYRSALRLTEPERDLYLAVPEDVYDEFFRRRFIQRIIIEYQLKLLIFNPEKEEILQWRD